MELTDINDVKWKLDIINYDLLFFVLFFCVFIYLFYYFLSKYLWNNESLEEKNIEQKWLFDDIKTKLKSIKSLENEEFYEKYSQVFFEFTSIIYWNDLRKKTLKELKKNIKDKEIIDIIISFYYKWFMNNLENKTDDREIMINNFLKQIEKREWK